MELIAAIATGPGSGGVAVVRLSGDGALGLAKKMFSRRGEFVPNMLYAGRIRAEEFTDYGYCVYFRAPRSFTGEDVVEFHCHGGREIASGVLKNAVRLGARAALAGEFTRRAYLNGKLSLSAAEGMGEMIAAESAAQVRAGYSLLSEKLTGEGKEAQRLVKECLAAADADADFPEEDLSLDVRAAVIPRLENVLARLNALLSERAAGKKIKSGVCVVLCGRPNAGKSALFNALLGYERAIVSASAGTTRDVLEGEIELHGVRFRLVDTAGLRTRGSLVEREGIRRAQNQLKAADLILYLKEEGDGVVLPKDVPVLTLGAKCDLKKEGAVDLFVSARTGEGIEALKEMLYEKGFGKENEGVYLLNERHLRALQEAKTALERALYNAEAGAVTELIAEDLRSAYTALGLISGETATEEIIEEIFSKFCVGK